MARLIEVEGGYIYLSPQKKVALVARGRVGGEVLVRGVNHPGIYPEELRPRMTKLLRDAFEKVDEFLACGGIITPVGRIHEFEGNWQEVFRKLEAEKVVTGEIHQIENRFGVNLEELGYSSRNKVTIVTPGISAYLRSLAYPGGARLLTVVLEAEGRGPNDFCNAQVGLGRNINSFMTSSLKDLPESSMPYSREVIVNQRMYDLTLQPGGLGFTQLH